jgi:CheY-like chemotaxis protein/ribosome-associated translation inhibitor RaiA
MNIQVRSVGLDASESLREHAERRVRECVAGLVQPGARVVVFVTDVNGPKGGVCMRSRISLRAQGRLVHAEALDVNLYAAIDRASLRLKRALQRRIGRARHRLRLAPEPEAPPLPEQVLVAEDDADLRGSLAAELGRRGYAVTVARDGSEASDLLAEQPVDSVVLDVRMPGRSGLEILREMRRRGSRVPVVLISGFADGVSNAGEAHEAVVLAKPFSVAELREALDQARAVVTRAQPLPAGAEPR